MIKCELFIFCKWTNKINNNNIVFFTNNNTKSTNRTINKKKMIRKRNKYSKYIRESFRKYRNRNRWLVQIYWNIKILNKLNQKKNKRKEEK